KDAPETLDGQVEALVAQKKQRLAIARSAGPLEPLIPGSLPCGEALYESVYRRVPGCSPMAEPSCGRWLVDEVASLEEVAAMRSTMQEAFAGLYHSGPLTSLALGEAFPAGATQDPK
ncbi:unnamed protein product, partial [Effrenium voratum]